MHKERLNKLLEYPEHDLVESQLQSRKRFVGHSIRYLAYEGLVDRVVQQVYQKVMDDTADLTECLLIKFAKFGLLTAQEIEQYAAENQLGFSELGFMNLLVNEDHPEDHPVDPNTKSLNP